MALLDNLDSLAQTGSEAELDKELSALRKMEGDRRDWFQSEIAIRRPLSSGGEPG